MLPFCLSNFSSYCIDQFLEPVKLIGEGEYKLDVLKEIVVTDSYLGLDKYIRGCQNEEPLENCTTRSYIENLVRNCGCLPLTIRLTDKVICR